MNEVDRRANRSATGAASRCGLTAPLLLLSVLVVLVMAAAPASGQQQPGRRVFYMGMLLGMGGLGDRSFNDSAYEGLRDAQNRFGIRFEVADFVSQEMNVRALRDFARQRYDLIIGIGFENRENIERVASEHPDLNFAIIDVVAEGDNIASVIYREQEGDFLVGVLAAMLTASGRVGMVGGMDIPVIRRIESGFRQGVAYQNPAVEVVVDLAGTFSDAEKGRELARRQYAAGVDVIYNAAGRTGLGIIRAAEETGNLTIGTSGDQRYLAPGHVVGNRPKRVDRAVLTLVEEIKNGRFEAGIRSFGLREGGLSLGPFDRSIVTPQILRRLDELKEKIIRGEIDVSGGG